MQWLGQQQIVKEEGREINLMRNILSAAILSSVGNIFLATMALGDWSYSGPPTPNAFIQSGDMALELQCDRIRFVPASYEYSVDIESKQGLSIRFLKNGSTEAGAFQVGRENASIQIMDNFPVEIVFSDLSSYDFVLDQIAQNAILKLTMIDQDVSYAIFDLKGSAKAISSLRSACRMDASAGSSTPEPIVTDAAQCTEVSSFDLAAIRWKCGIANVAHPASETAIRNQTFAADRTKTDPADEAAVHPGCFQAQFLRRPTAVLHFRCSAVVTPVVF